MMLECVDLERCSSDDLDRLCDHSEDAWFWHTSAWHGYARRYTGAALKADVSFMVLEDKVPQGACACFVESRDGKSVLGFNRERIYWPVVRAGASQGQRNGILDAVFSRLQRIARENSVARVELTSTPLAAAFYGAPQRPADLPGLHGFRTTVLDTQVIDLRQPPEQLWRGVRKGHKAAIKAGRREYDLSLWRGRIDDSEFRAYVDLHGLAAGGAPRAPETYDYMRDWIRAGSALLLGARHAERWVAFVVFLVAKRAAYYASACRHPELPGNSAAGHLLLWEGLEALRSAGIQMVELGPQHYGADTAEAKKLAAISHYKRGFGGVAMPRYLSDLDLADFA